MEQQTNIVAFNELSTQHQKDHRAKIGVRVESILLNFWREDGVSDIVRVCEIQGWVDVLETCSHSEIRAAWAEYQRSGPRNQLGRLLKPDAGALWRIVMASRPRPKPVQIRPQVEEPPRERMSPERVRQIMREVFGGTDAAEPEAQSGALGALAKAVLQGYSKEPEGSQ